MIDEAVPDSDSEPDLESEVSRPVALATACVLLLLGPIGVAAGIAIAADPRVLPIVRWIGGGVGSLCGIASVIWGMRLLSGRRHVSGGLMSATALRLSGLLLLGLSLFSWIAALNDGRDRMIAIAQATIFTAFAWAAFMAARGRSAALKENKKGPQ